MSYAGWLYIAAFFCLSLGHLTRGRPSTTLLSQGAAKNKWKDLGILNHLYDRKLNMPDVHYMKWMREVWEGGEKDGGRVDGRG
jgi:hypothetical protein